MFCHTLIAAMLTIGSIDAGAPGADQRGTDSVLPLVVGDGYQGVIFPAGSLNSKDPQADVHWTPSVRDVREFERGLSAALRAALRTSGRAIDSTCRPGDSLAWCREFEGRRKAEIRSILGKLTSYRRQYMGVVTADRKTLVANFFPSVQPDGEDWHQTWRYEWVDVLGGGTDYWSISFDLQEKRFNDFHANSPR